jgi:hypothetical protein
MNRFSTVLTVSLLCLGLAIPAGDAVAQSAKDLVGTWTPVSVEAYGPNLQIPRHSGQVFRSDADRDSDLKPATIPN